MKIDCKNNDKIRNGFFGVGMEKLDRDAFDPKKVYDYVALLGVKWVRIQSGWAKTEKEKGKYDFSWLDEIVEELTKRDLSPWICLCYGNPVYDKKAAKIAGGLNCPPIENEESEKAWLKYCASVAHRYRGKVVFYEVWNEPEWLWSGPAEPATYACFCIKTAAAVKSVDEDAKVIVGSVASISPDFLEKCAAEGITENADAVSYHAYTYDERTFSKLNAYYLSLFTQYKKDVKIIHGECGSQSKNGGNGAFKGFPTDPKKQAKQLLRQMVTDRASEVFFSSFFTMTDMHENLMAPAGKPILKHGYFGLLSASFDGSGIACAPFTPKPSFYAYQNLCAFLPESAKRADVAYWIEKVRDDKNAPFWARIFKKSKKLGSIWRDPRLDTFTTACFENKKGKAFVYWLSTDLIREDKGVFFADIRFACDKEPRLVDLLTGEIKTVTYERTGGSVRIPALPVTDYPMAVVFGDFVQVAD